MVQAQSGGLIDWLGRGALALISITIAGSIMVSTLVIYTVAIAVTLVVEVFDYLSKMTQPHEQ